MLLKKRRMVWSAKCLESRSKTLFWAIVLEAVFISDEAAKRHTQSGSLLLQ
jgi:hypothetical protein